MHKNSRRRLRTTSIWKSAEEERQNAIGEAFKRSLKNIYRGENSTVFDIYIMHEIKREKEEGGGGGRGVGAGDGGFLTQKYLYRLMQLLFLVYL